MNKMSAKVSIIIPIYNTEKYLERCMESVFGQTLKEIEIILVDDESPDGAPAMCDSYAAQDDRVKVIHKKNGGLGLARNSGLEIATGEYVAFLDSDDYVSLDMYEKLYKRAVFTQAETCFCGCSVDYGNGTYDHLPFALGESFFDNNIDIIKNVLVNVLGAKPEDKGDNCLGMQVWRGIYSTKLIRKYSIKFCSEREYICEDAIFHIDYFKYSNSFASIEDCCYYYCVYDVSLSRIYREDRFERNVIFYEEEVRRLKENNLYTESKVYIERMFLALIRGNIKDACFNMGKNSAIDEIKNIMENPVVQHVIADYPYRKNPIKTRVLNFLVHKRFAVFMYCLCKLKTKQRR